MLLEDVNVFNFWLLGFRQWTATHISGCLLIREQRRFRYKVQLFKLHDDSFLFERFRELFESEVPLNLNQSISEAAWVPNQVRNGICGMC